ncbi:hypothetical protein, partial [Rossellomorea marisflavi]|uniref:hypothetical protein n=1 Tax=Rossellomorea marisflavi TaxID=189381 RepID=UPI00295EAD32
MLSLKFSGVESENVIDYWKGFFPELKDINAVNEIISKTSNLNLEGLNEKWENNNKNLDYKTFVEDVFNSLNQESVIDPILNTLPQADFPYLEFIVPLFKKAIGEWETKLESLDKIHNKPYFYQNLIISCYKITYKMVFRTLILETNIAKDHGWLVGENPETRANYFKFVLLKEPAYLKTLYVEY